MDAQLQDRAAQLPDDTTAGYVLNLWTVRRQMEIWQRELPQIRPFYAVKANSTPELVQALLEMGAGADCASPSEIEMVLKLGARPTDIVYSNTQKHEKGVKLAETNNVDLTTADSLSELLKIKRLYPETRVLLRITVADADAQCPMSHKFGCPPSGWKALLSTSQTLELNLVGVHFHAGSGCSNFDAYREAVEDASALFSLAKDFGFSFSVLDVGGGYPGEFNSPAFVSIAKILRTTIARHPCFDHAHLVAEPGRFFCCASQVLAARVIGVKGVECALPDFVPRALDPYPSLSPADLDILAESNVKLQYFLNTSVYGMLSSMIYDHVDPELVVPSQPGQPLLDSIVFGHSCDGIDVIKETVKLPPLKYGDLVFIPNVGAYTQVSASSFNGFHARRPLVVDVSLD
ncbi:MAG: hypothetical protein KVP17_001264 [Porospora cf. gigantea B]|uniref:uncharacterized protein n=1 Tax=Porospora cf. gigantea B TaxID=2853592 RepID=UPI003571E772|nr:MAG: hypothetical protein KVP17_001264 [Porospora cf. gigantea B]